jgi:Cu/Ag efflux protein CusF
MNTRSLLVVAVIFVMTGAQAGTLPNTSTTIGSLSVVDEARLPLTEGIIEEVLSRSAEIVIAHGDLPNLGMPPMTMAFDVVDKHMLNAVKPGDKVRFQADILNGAATITHLEKSR